MRRTTLLALAPLAALTGCPSTVTPNDAGDAAPDIVNDATPDVPADTPAPTPDAGCVEVTAIHSIYPGPLYLVTNTMTTHVQLRLHRDRVQCGADYTVTTDDPTIATAQSTVHIDPTHGQTEFTVTGHALGHTRLHVAQVNTTNPVAQSAIDVFVLPSTVPACPAAQSTTGHLAPGATVHGTVGSALEFASVAVPATATTAPALDVTIACAPDQVPAGFTAVGPAVTFGPALPRFPREIPITIPVNPALVPPYYELQTEVAYTAPGSTTPRIVPLANTRFTPDGHALSFYAPHLGTYQAVLRSTVGTTTRRHYTYHAIMGFSMGALGASMIGMRHSELFDAVMPLGGPADWGWFGDYFRRWHLGGFCTAAERAAMGDAACAMATNARTPPPEDYWTVQQNFEWWNYPDGRGGQGGTFDRNSYITIYHDLSHMFGNPAMPTLPDLMTPVGVPANELSRTDADRCAHPVVLDHYYDDEYNPDGSLPVITFCDGMHVPGHAGEFQPGPATTPFELSLAVDINRNGVRDPGEPVIRNLYEPWQDIGTDGLADRDEPGYDPVSNPDPHGDDYDRQYNPAGTERNFLRETGEPYSDVGLDGIACPAAGACPYDVGEGNGTWDVAPGVRSFYDRNPRHLYATLSPSDADRVAVWADGGTRDLFNFGASANHFTSAMIQQGEAVHLFNNFSALIAGHAVDYNSDNGYVWTDVDYAHLPRHSTLRYGFEDATPQELIDGDGGHVGTTPQITNRALTAIGWVLGQWPNGNREVRNAATTPDDAGRCANGYVCTFQFTSPHTHRTGPVSITLPPGYHRAENASETYPVIFFLHGYGMDPMALLPSGLLINTYASMGSLAEWQRPSKVIMVFPDGRCRDGDGCPQGTFYTDSPNPSNAQMDQYFLDLYDFVTTTYRVHPPEDVTVTE